MATTIQVGDGTRDGLKGSGHKGRTYDSVTRRLLRAREYVRFIDGEYAALRAERGWKRLQDLP